MPKNSVTLMQAGNPLQKLIHSSRAPRLGRRGTPLRPGPGRPGRVELCGLFLPSVGSVMALDGMPARKLFAEHGLESLFRRIFEPVWSSGNEPPQALVEDLRRAIERLRAPDVVARSVLRALGGDSEAQVDFAGRSEWEMAWLAQLGTRISWLTVVMEHGAEVAAAGREVDCRARAGEFDRMPALVRSSMILDPYLSPTALRQLGHDAPQEAQLRTRAAGTCEFLLSQVARVDAHPSVEPVEERGRRFVEMVAERNSEPCVPGRGFVGWMMQRYKAGSLTELWKLAPADKNGRGPIGYNSLQGWHSGATTPNRTKAESFVGAIARHQGLQRDALRQEWRCFDLHMWAATRLEAVLRLVKYLAAIRPQSGIPDVLALLEAAGPDEWCRRRYSFWLRHWAERQTVA